ncbi:MAG: hypothetical protein LBG27_10605 [Spirochaetaceae bacterium]|jgi:hypothetical protein|nr:hypothetical protein [Spirochaetaceae bacterium]
MEDRYRKEIEGILEKYKDSPLDVINIKLQELTYKYNNMGRSDFDGLSPEQMRGLLYFNCNENMIKIKDDKGEDIPIIKQVKYYLNIVRENEGIKLTKAGNLPPAIVKEVYSKRYLPDMMIELGLRKITKETDVMTIELTNILCQLAGLIKKKKNTISLIKRGELALKTGNLFSVILSVFVSKFNWPYYDRYEDEKIGQFGAYFSIYLLSRYGNEKRNAEFYANKYFRAFFKEYIGINTEKHHAYSLRTFDRFLKYFGFLEEFNENKLTGTISVKKTELFEKYIEVK